MAMRLGPIGMWIALGIFGLTGGSFSPGTAAEEQPAAADWGTFEGKPQLEPAPDAGGPTLRENFSYRDPRKKVWTAEKGFVFAGKSLPRAVRDVLGDSCRDAALVHDAACARPQGAAADTHLMLYEACRACGLPDAKAKLAYVLSLRCGPRWETKKVQEVRARRDANGAEIVYAVERDVISDFVAAVEPDPAMVRRLQRFIENRDPTLETLRNLKPKNP